MRAPPGARDDSAITMDSMLDPAGLYDISAEVVDVPAGLHLVAGLTGFADAGGAVTQFAEYLLDTLDHSRGRSLRQRRSA